MARGYYASVGVVASNTGCFNMRRNLECVCGISTATLSIADLLTVAGSVLMARVLVLAFSFSSRDFPTLRCAATQIGSTVASTISFKDFTPHPYKNMFAPNT
ncbi:hypothetical protein C8R45DRAFT_1224624 [Mycena sanguinolenta]|nr:hypothetical protein C8R45DRAFT_1224624 [Mycena sanguinolenta]